MKQFRVVSVFGAASILLLLGLNSVQDELLSNFQFLRLINKPTQVEPADAKDEN